MSYSQSEKKDIIHVCFCIDRKYIVPCCTTIISIIKNSNKFFHFHIISSRDDFLRKTILSIFKKNTNCKISFTNIHSSTFADVFIPANSHFTIANYYRIKIPSLLPNLEKIIYLDSDIIVNSDLYNLWSIQVDEYHYLGATSMNNKINSKRLGLKDGIDYINSGVLVMNLKKIRNENVEEKLMEICKNNEIAFLNVDQDVINIFINKGGKIKYIDQRYNVESRSDTPILEEYLEIFNSPYIIHYLSYDKPWNKDTHQFYLNEYCFYQNELKKQISSLKFYIIKFLSQNINAFFYLQK